MDHPNLKERIELYVSEIQRLQTENWEQNQFTFAPVPKVEIKEGNKFIRVFVVEYGFDNQKRSSCIHTFVDRETGDIWKAATYKEPQKNGIRGNIFNEPCITGVNNHGAIYRK